MSRTSWRVLRTELLRGAAPAALLVTLGAGLPMMYSLANSASGWAGKWMPWAVSVRQTLWVVGPLIVACAVWQASRERRRKIDQQLAATPRAPWQSFVIVWAAVTLGAMAALVVIVVPSAVLVGRVASYSGGGWHWVLAVTFPAVAALSAVGAALGRVVPSRVVAPVAGVVTFFALTYTLDLSDGASAQAWLSPVMSQWSKLGHQLSSAASAQQALFFAGLAATVLVLAAARRKVWAALPSVVTIAVAVPLLAGARWEADPAASELVCTDGRPEVCLTRVNAFLLEDDEFISRIRERVEDKWNEETDPPARVVERRKHSVDGLGYSLPAGPEAVDLAPYHGASITGAAEMRSIDLSWNERFWGCKSGIGFYEFNEALQGFYKLPESEVGSWWWRYHDAMGECDEQLIADLLAELP